MNWRIVLLALFSIGWGILAARYGWRAWRAGEIRVDPDYGAPFVVKRQDSPIGFWADIVLSTTLAPVFLIYGVFVLATGRLY